MNLQTLTRGQCQLVREWRNVEPQFLRTPYLITEKMQDEFFDNVVNDRDSKHRYFGIVGDVSQRSVGASGKIYEDENIQVQTFIGMAGLTNIEWENGTAEISLIINPEYRGQGKGKDAVDLLLLEALRNMRLISVYGEVYYCGNIDFWNKVIDIQMDRGNKTHKTTLTQRKFYNGQMYDSMWFMMGGKP